ncbi:hypothetical protein D9M72_489250 [compost metagenome]
MNFKLSSLFQRIPGPKVRYAGDKKLVYSVLISTPLASLPYSYPLVNCVLKFKKAE